MTIFGVEKRIMRSEKTQEVQGRSAVEEQSDAVCSRCGNFGAEVIYGDLEICRDCYYIYGSCCLEFGAYDLWAQL
jgi:hypothetical protein